MTTHPEHPDIQLVLDTSAITAFTHGSVAVGELLGVIDFEGGVVALPVLCLTESTHSAADMDRLDVLVHHTATTTCGVASGDWRLLAYVQQTTGRLDAAQAMTIAIDHDTDILSSTPGLYHGLDAGPTVIPIDHTA